MKELFCINDSLANKISYYHLMLFLLSLPFDRFFSHLILASLAVHTIIHFNKLAVKPIFNIRTVALQSVFWVALIGTIHTINPAEAFNQLELDLPILLLPIILCLNPLDLKKYRPKLLMTFALGCTATILYLYYDALVTIRHYHMPLKSILSPAFTNHNFSEPINMHATFFSLQIAIALVFLLSVLINRQLTNFQKVVCAACCLILTAGIIQLSSKSVFVALFIIINLALPLFLLEGIRRRQYMVTTMVLSGFIVIGIFNSNAFRDRFLVELEEDLSPSFKGQTVEPRLERWKIAVDLIKKAPVLGYGSGSEIQLLQDKYFEKKFYSSYLHQLNAHNEYLSFMIRSGICGLIVYLLTLTHGFIKAIRQRDIVFFSFVLLIAIVSLSEDVLAADKGVFFYSFFFSYFVFVAEQQELFKLPIKRHKYLRQVATKRMAVPSSL